MSVLPLPSRLDLSVAQSLTRDILSMRGGPVTLDASGVAYLGGLGLQLLLAAARQWRQDGQDFAVLPRSGEFDGALALFGLSPDALMNGGSE